MSKKNSEVQFNEDQLMNLYGIQFAIAYADGELDKDELKKIFEVMDITGFSLEGKQKVQTYFLEPPILEEIISEMNKDINEIKYTAYMNAIEVAIANDDISQLQEVELKKIKESFDITDIQAEKMKEFAIKAKKIAERGIDDKYAADALKSGVAGLGAVGVPVAAVYFSGSVIGLSAAGITSGLAAVGLGFGMIPGIGVAIVLGAAIFIGLTKLFDVGGKRKKQKHQLQKERRAQLIIQNLQDTINMLLDKLEKLEEKAKDAEANKEAIKKLQDVLKNLRQIQNSKKREVHA